MTMASLVFGSHPCAALLATSSRTILRAFVSLDEKRLLPWLAHLSVPVIRSERSELDRVSRHALHQGVVFETAPLPALQELPFGVAPEEVPRAGGAPGPPLLVALDGLTDPHNVGAILRSALLLGADGVLTGAAGGAPVSSGTVSKASSGALEVWLAARRIHETRNLGTFLEVAAAAGWRILGASSAGAPGGGAPPSGKVQRPLLPLAALSREVPTILCLGSEGAGLRSSVRSACTAFVTIPMEGALQRETIAAAAARRGGAPLPPLPPLESLNVSVAAALILQQLRVPVKEEP